MMSKTQKAAWHARAAIGVDKLPFDLPVEIDLIIKIKQ